MFSISPFGDFPHMSAMFPDRDEKDFAETYTKLENLAAAIELVASQMKVFTIDRRRASRRHMESRP
jgi:hypothetical protein